MKLLAPERAAVYAQGAAVRVASSLVASGGMPARVPEPPRLLC
jgi:hypothetical protein